jgi:Rap1a immunity proteins
MRRVMLVAVALSSLVAGTAAHAGFRDGNKLFEDCKYTDTNSNTFPAGTCAGYIVGAVDALLETGAFCVPDGVEAGQVIDVVKLYLAQHPEKRHLAASDLVVDALKEKFPCN